MKTVCLGGQIVGEGFPLYFIADIAANHDGSLDRAFRLIELAKEAGANAAKFQNFQAATIVSAKGFESLGKQLSHQATWKRPVIQVYKDASLSFEWTQKLKDKCDEIEIEYFTSPYDFDSVDHVDPFVSVYKIGSGDITWLEIIEYIARKGKPIIIASGASNLEDVERAMHAIQTVNREIVLMQCNTNYTADPSNFRFINLRVLQTFRERFPETILGLSDHTPGHSAILGAVALGARVFEKHFTDDNAREGPDHRFAMSPKTWREMVERAGETYAALGDGVKRIEQNETEACVIQRRALRYTRDLSSGHILVAGDMFPLRPNPPEGISPYKISELIGRRLVREVSTDDMARWEDSAK